jgi:DNA-binding MarR family transcriptional regulator
VFLTERAKELRAEVRDAFREMETDLASIYTEEEHATLRRLLMKLHDHFAPDHPAEDHHCEPFGWKEEK